MKFDQGHGVQEPISTVVRPPGPTNATIVKDPTQVNLDKVNQAERQLANGSKESTLMQHSKTTLLELCQVRNLSVSGTKKDLIAALFEWVCDNLLIHWI